jgi:hypothetical protein
MEVDEVLTGSLDVCPVRELDILFFEVDREFFVHLGTNSVFIESTEYLSIFPLEGERYTLPIEIFLYLKSLREADASLITRSFFVGFDFLHTFSRDLLCDSLRYEGVACLRCRYLDELSLAPEVCDILEEFYGDLACCHSVYDFRI